MEIKRFYDPIAPDGSVLDRDEILASPAASGIVAEIRHQRKLDGKSDQAVSAAQIFAEMQKRGMIKELRCKSKVRITRLTVNGRQNLSQGLIKGGIAEGWLTLADDSVTIHGLYGDVVFNITRKPGRYCCHDGKYIEGPKGDGQPSRDYVAEHFPDTASPDPAWPAGYEVLQHYECQQVEG